MERKKKCPQCKNLILLSSPTCLYCGRPNKFITREYVSAKWNKKRNKKVENNNLNIKYIWIGLIVMGFLIVIYLK